jgi:hypothetical protein
MIKRVKTPGRNEKCPCGSGKKAKKCCLEKMKLVASLPDEVRKQILSEAVFQNANRQR